MRETQRQHEKRSDECADFGVSGHAPCHEKAVLHGEGHAPTDMPKRLAVRFLDLAPAEAEDKDTDTDDDDGSENGENRRSEVRRRAGDEVESS